MQSTVRQDPPSAADCIIHAYKELRPVDRQQGEAERIFIHPA
jgi:hypothetical protein